MQFRRFLPIFIIVFTNILGAGVILPILPLIAEGEFGATAFQAILLGAVFFAAQFLAAPWLGRLSDHIGRRPVLIGSQIGTVLSFVMFAFAQRLGLALAEVVPAVGASGGLIVLYAARILDGITGGNITTARAYIADVTNDEERAQALGLLSAAFGVGFIFGPAFGGLLSKISLVAPFVGGAVITSGSVLLTTLTLAESLPPEKRTAVHEQEKEIPLREFLQDNRVFLILLITFVVMLAFSALQSTFPLYMERVAFPDAPDKATVARNVGLILGFLGVVMVLTQGVLIGPLVKRLGEQQVVVTAQFLLVIAFAGLAVATNAWWVVLFLIPAAVGQGINQPSLQALMTRFGTPKTQGRLLGLFQSASSLGLIFGPIWSGYMFEHVGPRAPYWVAVPLLLMSGMLALVLRRQVLPVSRMSVHDHAV
ncbi:MAG: MFS transporter [Chloroflexi bacterium]|nr:MAG: MFS transporter [Chloroflexota bacterium]